MGFVLLLEELLLGSEGLLALELLSFLLQNGKAWLGAGRGARQHSPKGSKTLLFAIQRPLLL